MSEHKYAVVEAGLVTNVIVATESYAAQYMNDHPLELLVMVPEYNELDPNTHVIVETGCSYDGAVFSRAPRQVALEKENLKQRAMTALGDSNMFVQNDLWDTYTDEQKQAWTTYRATLRNIDSIMAAEDFDLDEYELPTMPI